MCNVLLCKYFVLSAVPVKVEKKRKKRKCWFANFFSDWSPSHENSLATNYWCILNCLLFWVPFLIEIPHMTSLEEFMVVNLYKIIAIINAQFIPSVVFTIHYYKVYLPCISFLRLIKNLNATTDQRFQMDKKHSSLQGKNNKSNANGGLLSVCWCRHFM